MASGPKGSEPRPGVGRPPWRRPTIQGLQTDGPPLCSPSFPQAQVCASNGLVQSSIGCSQKGIFS